MSKWYLPALVISIVIFNSDSVGAIMQHSACSEPASCKDILEVQTVDFIKANPRSEQDSRELQLQDMLILRLLPYMDDKLAMEYKNVLTVNPHLYPYFVNVVKTERTNGFRGFDLRIILQAIPAIGPHIPVGE